jgi:hypothetical protein
MTGVTRGALWRATADNTAENSLATRARRRRFAFFESLLAPLPRPLTILDVGGRQEFWDRMGFAQPGVTVVLLNLEDEAQTATRPDFRSLAGDARDLKGLADGEYEVVFSNSVIEHLGDFEDQRRMAAEVVRVGRRYFVQTPNRNFPVEPHFVFPLFQFLPRGLRVFLLMHFALGHADRVSDAETAGRLVDSIRLLDRGSLQQLFPAATLYREHYLGLVKSIVAYGGW